jgi:hypothetical protein
VFQNPVAFYNAVNRYTLAFFDVHIKGRPPMLLDRRSSEYPVVQTFRDLGMAPREGRILPPSKDAVGIFKD